MTAVIPLVASGITARYRCSEGSLKINWGARLDTTTIKEKTGALGNRGAGHVVISVREDSAEDTMHALNVELEERVKRRTAQLEESEARYRYLSENIQDIHYLMSRDGCVEYIGPQVQRYGFSQEDLLGQHFVLHVHPDDRDQLVKELQRTVETRQTFPSEFRIVDPDGGIHWFEERSEAECDSEGRVIRLTGLLRDITARKAEDRERIVNQERLRRLAARLASAQDEEQRRIAEGLHDDVAQLLTACSIKLAIARVAYDPAIFCTAMDDADAILAETQESVRRLSFELASSTLYRLGIVPAIKELCDCMRERYGITLEVTALAPELPLDRATATVLFKSVRELVFNVVKHAGVSQCQVVLSVEDGCARVTVRDEGRGFERLPADPAGASGEGYGLFSIQERLRDLGGRMDVASDPGVETCVTLWVPL